jgi:hypothetical protein
MKMKLNCRFQTYANFKKCKPGLVEGRVKTNNQVIITKEMNNNNHTRDDKYCLILSDHCMY